MNRKPFAWLAEAPQVAPPFAMPVRLPVLPDVPQLSYAARVAEPLHVEEDPFKVRNGVMAVCKNLQQRITRLQLQIVKANEQPHLRTSVVQWQQEVVVLQNLLPQLLKLIE